MKLFDESKRTVVRAPPLRLKHLWRWNNALYTGKETILTFVTQRGTRSTLESIPPRKLSNLLQRTRNETKNSRPSVLLREPETSFESRNFSIIKLLPRCFHTCSILPFLHVVLSFLGKRKTCHENINNRDGNKKNVSPIQCNVNVSFFFFFSFF